MFRLRTFGGLVLERDGAPHTGPATQRRRLALLALLAASESGVSRERLMSQLWPDSDPARARHSLDDALSAIRRDLRSDTVFLGVGTLRLDPDALACDLAEYAAALRCGDAERAVALYAGPFLDGFVVPDAADFDMWMELERARRTREHLRTLDALAEAATELRDGDTAVHWRRLRVAAYPLDTRATLQLLAALRDAGNPAEALRVARVHELLVEQELGSSPGPEWAVAVERLRVMLAPQQARMADTAPAGSRSSPDVSPAGSTSGTPATSDEGSMTLADDSVPVFVTPVTASPLPTVSLIAGTESGASAHGKRAPVSAFLLVALTLGTGFFVVARSRTAAPPLPRGSMSAVGLQRVLVVPFENATGDDALAPLGRMALDWVARGLAEVPGVAVTADLARPLQAGDAGLRVAAAENDAGTVVSGAYYFDVDSIRFQLRITETSGWVRRGGIPTVSAARSSPTTLLEPLRQRVMAVLAVAHDPRFAAFAVGTSPPTYAAYEQYLAGTELFEQGDWAGARPYYARAAALDSSYVQPLLGAADGEINLGHFGTADTLVRKLLVRRASMTPADRGSLDRIQGVLEGNTMGALTGARMTALAAPGAQLPHFLHAAAALRAGLPREALDAAAPVGASFGRVRTPWTGGVYWSVVTSAHHLLGEHEAERLAAEEAYRYHPDSPDVLAYRIRAYVALGRLDSVRRQIGVLEAMPASPGAGSLPALLLFVAQEMEAHGYHTDARAALREAAVIARGRSPVVQRTLAARFELARVLLLLGDYTNASPLLAELVQDVPDDPRYLGQQGLLAMRRGDAAEAARIDERLTQLRRPYDRGQTAYARAELAAARGARATALALLRQALSEGFPYGTQLHVDPELAPLRTDAAFRALLAPHG